MPKKKKNSSPNQVQKLAAAQYKNEFFRKFRDLLNVFCIDNLYKLIPASLLEEIYSVRSHPMHLIAKEGCQIPVSTLSLIKKTITNSLKEREVPIEEQDIKISIYDFITVGLSLFRFYIMLKEDMFKGADKIKSGLKKFELGNKLSSIFLHEFLPLFYTTATLKSRIGVNLLWISYEVPSFKDPHEPIYHRAYLHNYIPKSVSIQIDGINRPAFLLEWGIPQVGPKNLCIKPSELNINCPTADMPMKIYIQNHALVRLAERIDCVDICFVHLFVIASLHEPKVFYDNNHNLLIEYRLSGSRAGYFRADIVDGNIVLRTFLFITNNGTPEGQLLAKNIGVNKLDKKFLAIDKLSTFMTSEMMESEFLINTLNDSGCHSLIELYKSVKGFLIKGIKHPTAAFIEKYLKVENAFVFDEN